MHIGVIRENDTENRVSIVPNSVKKLIKAGFEVSIETGAGDRSNHSDSEYENMGAKVINRNEIVKSNILVSRRPCVSIISASTTQERLKPLDTKCSSAPTSR